MIEDDFGERPIAWEVAAVDARAEFAESRKLYRPKPHRERFATKDLANARKLDLQGAGMVASVTPIFVSEAKQAAVLRKRQIAPMGAFCAGWKLAQ